MLITAFAGAAGAWRWGSALLECKAPDLHPELMQTLGAGRREDARGDGDFPMGVA